MLWAPVDQNRLYRVVLVMSHANGLGLNVLLQLGKEGVAQFARGHFDAHLVQRSVCLCVEMDAVQFDALTSAEFHTEQLVSFSFLPSELKVAVNCFNTIA